MYYRGCDGILIDYDITDEQSFTKAKTWYYNVQKHTDVTNKFIMLIGNKCDKGDIEGMREVETESAQIYAHDIRSAFVECSAKTGKRVGTEFAMAAKMEREKVERREGGQSWQSDRKSTVDLTTGKNTEKGKGKGKGKGSGGGGFASAWLGGNKKKAGGGKDKSWCSCE